MASKKSKAKASKKNAPEDLAARYPSTAPVPLEEAVENEQQLEEKQGKLTLSDRVDVLEQALGALGLDLAGYRPRG
jgi:hypothetical protein